MRKFGHIAALLSVLGMAILVEAAEVTVHVSNTTPNCRDASVQEHRVCAQPSETILGIPSVQVVSRAGGSNILSKSFDQKDPNCYVVQTRAVPNGEQCIRFPFGRPVCNCKGRGWIALDITVTTEPAKHIPSAKR